MSSLTNAIGSTVDTFVNNGEEEEEIQTTKYSSNKKAISVGVIIGFVVYAILVLFAGKGLWDNVLCKAVPGCKPLPNVWHFLGLVLLFDLLIPSRR